MPRTLAAFASTLLARSLSRPARPGQPIMRSAESPAPGGWRRGRIWRGKAACRGPFNRRQLVLVVRERAAMICTASRYTKPARRSWEARAATWATTRNASMFGHLPSAEQRSITPSANSAGRPRAHRTRTRRQTAAYRQLQSHPPSNPMPRQAGRRVRSQPFFTPGLFQWRRAQPVRLDCGTGRCR